MRAISIIVGTLLLLQPGLHAVEITIHKKDATVWAQDQVIIGEVDTETAAEGLFLCPTYTGPASLARAGEW